MSTQRSPQATTVEKLAAHVQQLTERVSDLEAELKEKTAQIETLEAGLQEERQKRHAVEDRLADAEQKLDQIEFKGVDCPDEADAPNLFIAGIPIGQMVTSHGDAIDRLEHNLEDHQETIQDEITSEENTRVKEDSKIRRRLSHVEDTVGIDVPEAIHTAEAGTDTQHLSKLERFIRHGPEAVTDGRVYPVHERAREIALNLADWGTKINDAYGKRVRLRSVKDNLKTHLEAAFDRSFQWGEVYRAMEKLDDLAEGSQLSLKHGTKDEGKYVLELKFSDGRGSSFATE
ncbi:hypothetical protein [Halorussus salinisoli]|uniref:hypothetical protein n=1 Tax=Halorussus salinisoli TaxID=2558242 RepID=UPI0010C1601F|nr:hypothetical protein [Halorussus salinisoli]